MVKFSRGKVIVFDIDEALSFEGESGPVPAVRRRPRQQHLQQAEGTRRPRRGRRRRGAAVDRDRRRSLTAATTRRTSSGAWCSKRRGSTKSSTRRSARWSSRSLAKYAFGLAQAFNGFYHGYSILNEEREDARLWRAAAVAYYRQQLTARARADGLHGAGEDVARGRHDNRPVIGITRCSRLDDYVASVEQAGGRPRVLEVSESPRKVVGEIDGLLLTGGGDVDPVLYGEERHPTVEDAEPGRDEFEIDLARRAIDADLPLLAICRGAQVLNVAAGGTLVQDIPTAVDDRAAAHRRRAEGRTSRTTCAVAPGSRLQQALGDAVDAARTRAASTAVITSRSARVGTRLVAVRHGARRRGRSDRGAGRAILRRRAVAPGELLADRGVQAAVRRLRGGGETAAGQWGNSSGGETSNYELRTTNEGETPKREQSCGSTGRADGGALSARSSSRAWSAIPGSACSSEVRINWRECRQRSGPSTARWS